MVEGGIKRKKKVNGLFKREQAADVPCSLQNIHYSDTFHLINKRHGTEANKYADLAGQNRNHGWSPKLSL